MLPNLLGSNYVVQLLNSSLNEALPLLFLFFFFLLLFPFQTMFVFDSGVRRMNLYELVICLKESIYR